MRFSEHFRITRIPHDDWFDPILPVDTRLFLDPFLLYASESGPFIGSHAEVVAFFNSVFQRIASSGGDRATVAWRRSEDLLAFPEVPELCLGYTAAGTAGAGSGRGFAKLIAGALWEAVQAGVREIRHFEEIGIVIVQSDADRRRFSDIQRRIMAVARAAGLSLACVVVDATRPPSASTL